MTICAIRTIVINDTIEIISHNSNHKSFIYGIREVASRLEKFKYLIKLSKILALGSLWL